KHPVVKGESRKSVIEMCTQNGQVEGDTEQLFVAESAIGTGRVSCIVKQLGAEIEVTGLVDDDAQERFMVYNVLDDFIEEQTNAREQTPIVSVFRFNIRFNCGLQVSFLFGKRTDVRPQLLEPMNEFALPLKAFNIGAQRHEFAREILVF